MEQRDLDSRSNQLEEAFFAKQHAEVLNELRTKTPREESRDLLREVVRIDNEAFLDRLIALQVKPETALALRLVPLICVAWADGDVDERERKALLDAASQFGVGAAGKARALLESGLARKPDPATLQKWKAYVTRLWSCFTADERLQMRYNLLGSAREVAEAAGGFLGLTSKISAAERAVLKELEEATS